ncbi:hypothetical protein EVAR_45950_1 [Eumeta japonica]|uniref:Uncharacterized protein n=1 Tax=Eumeta variegata TaxID=151549 RepID=A0A4C1W6J6_EUMVA|nr:hypothetical protein EVAR_45950_1 [Eumeta japonica]
METLRFWLLSLTWKGISSRIRTSSTTFRAAVPLAADAPSTASGSGQLGSFDDSRESPFRSGLRAGQRAPAPARRHRLETRRLRRRCRRVNVISTAQN